MNLRKVRKNWKKFKKQATELQALVNERYTEEQMYKSFCDALGLEVQTSEDEMVIF